MDRNQLIGMTLISVMIILYAQITRPITKPTPPIRSAHVMETLPDNHEKALVHTTPSVVSRNVTSPPPQRFTLENDCIQVVLSSQGGHVEQVLLKKYKDHHGEQLVLLDKQSSVMGFQLPTQGGQDLRTQDLRFEVEHFDPSSPYKVVFKLPLGPNQFVRNTFTLSTQGYTVDQAWEVQGFDDTPVRFAWHNFVKRAEEDLSASRSKTTLNYYLSDDTFKSLKISANKKVEQTLDQPLRWVGVKQRFFTAGVIAQDHFAHARLYTVPATHSDATVKETYTQLGLPEQVRAGRMTFYFGPNIPSILEDTAKGFGKNVSLGWPVVRWVNRFLILPTFDFLAQHLPSHGLVIVVLVLSIKTLLLPLSYKSYLSMAKMRVLKPALDHIREQHKDDLPKMQAAQMQLYREMGVNPLSGCVPVLLQMPILLAMFNFLPNAIALRQKSFLWANDLSTYDALLHLPFSIPGYGSHVSLFTLLMTASTIVQARSSQQSTPSEGPMRALTYIMPLTFMMVLNSFPAALSLYYFVSNLVTFGQQYLIKKFVDEKDLQRRLEAHRNQQKTKKSFKFGERLSNWLRKDAKR